MLFVWAVRYVSILSLCSIRHSSKSEQSTNYLLKQKREIEERESTTLGSFSLHLSPSLFISLFKQYRYQQQQQQQQQQQPTSTQISFSQVLILRGKFSFLFNFEITSLINFDARLVNY